jgi:hypothetical protein
VEQARATLEEKKNAPVTEDKEEKVICMVLCPICRTDNSIYSPDDCKIFGIDQKCVVCTENTLDVLLPECKHACLCRRCFDILARTQQAGAADDLHYYANAVEETRPILDTAPDNRYIKVYAGMGCCIFVRKVGGVYSTFFMHQDSWGQYGPGTDETPALDRFLSGCTEIVVPQGLSVHED